MNWTSNLSENGIESYIGTLDDGTQLAIIGTGGRWYWGATFLGVRQRELADVTTRDQAKEAALAAAAVEVINKLPFA